MMGLKGFVVEMTGRSGYWLQEAPGSPGTPVAAALSSLPAPLHTLGRSL